jgi:succinoglycan biosynthesis transport protein ExoP
LDLREYVRLLRRRWRVVVLLTLVGVAVSVAVTATQTKTYTARAQLFVSAQDGGTSGDIGSAYAGGLFTQQRVKSYVSVLTSLRTAGLVKVDTGSSLPVEAIAKKISASAPLDTVLLNVAVSDPDPAVAQRLANSIGKVFPALVEDIERPAGGGTPPVKVSVVQPAALPEAATSPRPNLNLALGLLLGLGAGIGAAILRETLDTSVKGPEQAQELAKAPMLGAITFDSGASKRPLVVITAPSSPRAEAFRQLRTNLQFVDINHALRSVVITSSVPGEGKSTTACNLAVTLAQAGLRVVVVEADLRRPRVADYMGVEGAVGLTSVLLGRASLDDALQPWGDGMLQVLASGPLPPNPSELLGSAGMQELLHELEDRADIVLFDAPPLLPVTDAAVLGTLTSGVVMVVRSNKTRREQVARAAATVSAVGATTLGVILNMVPSRGPDAYAYGYGYSYTTGRDKTGRASAAESQVRSAATSRRASRDGSGAQPTRRRASSAEDVLPRLRSKGGRASK